MEERRRRKGTGTLFKRGKIWYMMWRRNGKRRAESTGETDYVKALRKFDDENDILALKAKEARLNALMHMHETVQEEIARRIDEMNGCTRLGRVAEIFRESPRRIDCSPRQLRTYISFATHLATWAGEDSTVSEIDDTKAEAYAAYLARSASPNTYNKHLNGLSLIWRTIGPSLGLDSDPWKRLPKRKLNTHVHKTLSDKDVTTIINAASGELRILLSVGAFTGMRLGDCTRLRWENINFAANTIDVVTGKTGARVSIPIHPALRDILGTPSSGNVIPGIARQYERDGSSVSRMILAFFEKCGYKTQWRRDDSSRAVCEIGFHSLRHSFVSRAIEAGVPPPVVQAIVGHASASMTEHYTHISDEAVLKAFANIK